MNVDYELGLPLDSQTDRPREMLDSCKYSSNRKVVCELDYFIDGHRHGEKMTVLSRTFDTLKRTREEDVHSLSPGFPGLPLRCAPVTSEQILVAPFRLRAVARVISCNNTSG